MEQRRISGPYKQEIVNPGDVVRAEHINGMPERVMRGLIAGEGLTKDKYGESTILKSRATAYVSGNIPRVAELPPIPSAGHKEVFWYGDDDGEGGTGDYQIWIAYAGQTEYTPEQNFSALSGVPVSI